MVKRDARGIAALASVLGVVAAGLIIGVGWYVYQATEKTDATNAMSEAAGQTVAQKKQEVPSPEPTKPVTAEDPSGIDTANWLDYKNDTLGFSFKYPDSWGQIDVRFNEPNFFLAHWNINIPGKDLQLELRGEPTGDANGNHGYFARGFTKTGDSYATNTNSQPRVIEPGELLAVSKNGSAILASEVVQMTGYIDLNVMVNLKDKQVAGLKLNFRRWANKDHNWTEGERMYNDEDVAVMKAIMSSFTVN